MRAVAVRRLALRVPSGHLAASRQRAEDALFLAAPDETRLLLLRRLDLGRLPPRAQADAWTARAARGMAERRARAVHAAQPGAESADAVWFRSVAEARDLLLRLLAAGQRPTAWFWRLAVPDWHDRPLSPWLADWVAAARADPPEEVALARAVLAVAAAGRLPAVVAALVAATLPVWERPAAPPAAPRPATPRPDAPRRAALLLARLDDPALRALRQAIVGMRPGDPAARWLVRLALVAAAPELAGRVATLAPLADVVVADPRAHIPVIAERTDDEAASFAVPDTALPRTQHVAPQAAWERPGPPAPDPTSEPDAPPRVAPAPPAAMAHPTRSALRPPETPADFPIEQASRGAGVLLTIRALDRLGLGEWLARDPDAAAAGFGRHLLRHVAARARLPPDDALFTLLDAPDPPPDPARLQAWRVGLDRWLRRRARLRLADLARRPGWLHLADGTLQVRLPLDSADLRLRRLVLDADPGWVPWLALVVRYHYRDAPLA